MVCVLIGILLTGCGGRHTVDDAASNVGIEVTEGTLQKPQSMMAIPAYLYNLCVIVSEWAALVMVLSIIVGIILADCFKKNTEVKQWALWLFCLKVPGIIFVVVFLYKILYSVFAI